MIQEDKELLLKDLCARIPYHPKGLMINVCTGDKYEEWLNYSTFTTFTATIFTSGTNSCRLYLRPMSSMTEEEENEYLGIDNLSYSCPMAYAHFPASERIDWLNRYHFDYRGLIQKGLALEVPEFNIKEHNTI